MTAPLIHWHERKLDRSPVAIRVHRPMLLIRHTETAPRHTAEGEAVTIERHLLGNLAADDYELLAPAPPPMDYQI